MEGHVVSVFYEISVLILLAAGLGLIGLIARQPLIVAFIAVGVLAGPDALGLVSATEVIDTLSKISIAVLLFLVGLKLDVTLVRALGRVAVVTGIGQMGFTAILGFVLCLMLGLDATTAFYISVALCFSSTIIIVKLLSDKREITALHGKIALGVLIVQDIFVILAMVTLSAIAVGSTSDTSALGDVAKVLAGGVALLAGVTLFVRYAATPLLTTIARSPELLVIFAVGWATSLATLGDILGLGKELGGLLAGVSLASTQFREAIGARLASLRDFLLLFFFVHLGASLPLDSLGDQIGAAVILSLFVMIGKPLIVLAIMGFLGYRKRTGFLAGITLAQISEFSLIFVAMGVSLGHLSDTAAGLVTLVGLVTIALSVYMISMSHWLYARAERYLALFERPNAYREFADTGSAHSGKRHDFVIFGLGRYGCQLGQRLAQGGHRVLGIDFDPEALVTWRKLGLEAEFGDATDPDFVAHLTLNGVRAVVAAVPRERVTLADADPQMALVHGLKAAGYQGKIVLSAQYAQDADALRAAGADLVLLPFDDAADTAAQRLAAC